jgi:hypothetical protein
MRHRVHRHPSFLGCATLSLALTLPAAGMVGIGESGERRVRPRSSGSATRRVPIRRAKADRAAIGGVRRFRIVLFGDEGKFVPERRKRVAAFADEPDRLTATVMFAPQEQSVRLFGYAAQRPTVTAETGSAGAVAFDKRTGRFEVSVSPSPEQVHEGPGRDPVRQAIVSLHGR